MSIVHSKFWNPPRINGKINISEYIVYVKTLLRFIDIVFDEFDKYSEQLPEFNNLPESELFSKLEEIAMELCSDLNIDQTEEFKERLQAYLFPPSK